MIEAIMVDFLGKHETQLFEACELRIFLGLLSVFRSQNLSTCVISDRDLALKVGITKKSIYQAKKNLSSRRIISYTVPEKKGGRGEDSKTKYSFCAVKGSEEIPQEIPQVPQTIPEVLVEIEVPKVEKVKREKAKSDYLMEVENAFKDFYKANMHQEYITTNFSMFRKQVNEIVAFIKSHLKVNLQNENPTESEIVEVFGKALKNYLLHWSWVKSNPKSIRIEMINKYLNDLIVNQGVQTQQMTFTKPTMKDTLFANAMNRIKQLDLEEHE